MITAAQIPDTTPVTVHTFLVNADGTITISLTMLGRRANETLTPPTTGSLLNPTAEWRAWKKLKLLSMFFDGTTGRPTTGDGTVTWENLPDMAKDRILAVMNR